VLPVVIASSPCTNSRGSDKVTLVIVEGTSNLPMMFRPLTSDTVEWSATSSFTQVPQGIVAIPDMERELYHVFHDWHALMGVLQLSVVK